MPLATRTYSFTCPWCWEVNTAIADLSVEHQEFIEDCQVCCHPIEISFIVDEHDLVDMTVEKAM